LIALERDKLDAAGSHGLFGWLWLGDLTDLPPRQVPSQPSDRERLLQTVVNGLKAHPRSRSGRASTSRGTPPAATRGSVRQGSSAATSACSSSILDIRSS
jgi:hypothetical protein